MSCELMLRNDSSLGLGARTLILGTTLGFAVATFGCSAGAAHDIPDEAEVHGAGAEGNALGQGDGGFFFELGTEDCCFTHLSSGCFIAEVQECVCDLAELCCLNGWADECVALATDTCSGCFARPIVPAAVASRRGVTGYCAFNGGQAGGGGLLIGLLGVSAWLARTRRRL